MKTLNIEVAFASRRELTRQIRRVESMIDLGIKSLEGDELNFTVINGCESRVEIVNGLRCIVIQSKMNRKKPKL